MPDSETVDSIEDWLKQLRDSGESDDSITEEERTRQAQEISRLENSLVQKMNPKARTMNVEARTTGQPKTYLDHDEYGQSLRTSGEDIPENLIGSRHGRPTFIELRHFTKQIAHFLANESGIKTPNMLTVDVHADEQTRSEIKPSFTPATVYLFDESGNSIKLVQIPRSLKTDRPTLVPMKPLDVGRYIISKMGRYDFEYVNRILTVVDQKIESAQ